LSIPQELLEKELVNLIISQKIQLIRYKQYTVIHRPNTNIGPTESRK